MSTGAADRPGARFSHPGEATLQCAIVFLDLVGYSARPVDDQVMIKKRLNLLLKRILRHVPADQRLAIDTGDGAAVCFLGEPLVALQSALLLRDLLAQRYGSALALRIGLHLGAVRVVPDVNGARNVVGDGINVAQRIMDFALPGQVLLSKDFHDAVVLGSLPPACAFQDAGLHQDKHGRTHALYRVEDAPAVARVREPEAAYAAGLLPAPIVLALEQALSRQIGPMARLLMAQALEAAAPDATLPQALAAHIAPGSLRDAFLEDARQILAGGSLRPPPGPPRR